MSLELRRRSIGSTTIPKDAIIVAERSDNEAALMSVIYSKGWSASPKYMRKSEAEKVTCIGTAFNGNTSITDFSAFKYFTKVTSIEITAFYGCTNLEYIELPDSITSIGKQAFYNCSKMNIPYLPQSIVSMGDGAFTNCNKLSVSELPQSIKSLGIGTFSNTQVAFHGKLNFTSIPDQCFKNTKVHDVIIPDTCTTIGNYAFNSCTSLNSVVIGNNVTVISDLAFDGCGLNSVVIGNSVQRISYRAFNNNNFTSIELPNTLTHLGKSTFGSCKNLTKIIIPNQVKILPESLLNGCTKLESVVISNTCTTIDGLAFGNCTALATLIIPSSVTSITHSFIYGSGVTKLIIECVTPPAFTKTNYFPSRCVVYVPDDSLELYLNDEQWGKIGEDKIKPISELPQ